MKSAGKRKHHTAQHDEQLTGSGWRLRWAAALTFSSTTFARDEAVVVTLVFLIFFQLCSVRLGVAAVAPANTSRNTELSRAAEFCCRVLKLRCARAVRTLILKGSDSQQRTTEIYVPSSNIVIRRFHAQTP